MTQSATNIPEGYLEDAQGRLVPVGSIRPIDLARDDLVREKIAKIKAKRSAPWSTSPSRRTRKAV